MTGALLTLLNAPTLEAYTGIVPGTLVSYELTRDKTCEESCGQGGGGVQPWAR
jgi:hypothetical protein